jgi:DNA-binding transcriptional ArsR family regulator
MTVDFAEFDDDARDLYQYIAFFQPITRGELADEFGIAPRTIGSKTQPLRDANLVTGTQEGYVCLEPPEDFDLTEIDTDSDSDDTNGESDSSLPNLGDVEQGTDPDPSELTEREEYLAKELQTGVAPDAVAEELGTRVSVVHQHLRDLKRQGWQVYVDESAGQVAIEGDHNLRSSEHTGTRTRKANRWWELNHNALVRQFKSLALPDTDRQAHSSDGEDWVIHLTDLHAGDRVRTDDGTVIYSTEEVPSVVDYVTEQALNLADTHGADYDTCHLLFGGDFLTNEGIYEGQFENLDAWLDEQHNTLVAPLLRQIKALSRRFETVNIVCQVGNHGDHRASGTSRQANADLVLYKTLRNVAAELQTHTDLLDNIRFRIGSAKAYRNFHLRAGKLRGHLRHGQHRRPQAETSARKKEWLSTLREHEFDIAFMGHHHISGRIPWDGPPILCTASPKPSGEFVERLGEGVAGGPTAVATVCGVSDDGITAVFPIDDRHYPRG